MNAYGGIQRELKAYEDELREMRAIGGKMEAN